MKIQVVTEKNKIARKFKSESVPVHQGEAEIKRLLAYSKEKHKGKAVRARLVFIDEVSGRLETTLIFFDQNASTNVSYYATQMLEEKFSEAPQEVKDVFLERLSLGLNENPTTLQKEQESTIEAPESTPLSQASAPMQECLNCFEDIKEGTLFCPYCGASQKPSEEKTQEGTPSTAPYEFHVSDKEYEAVEVEIEPPKDYVQTKSIPSSSIEVAPLWGTQLPKELQEIIDRGQNFKGKSQIRMAIFDKYEVLETTELEQEMRVLNREEEVALLKAKEEFEKTQARITTNFEGQRREQRQKIKDKYAGLISTELQENLELERQKADRFATDMGQMLRDLIERT